MSKLKISVPQPCVRPWNNMLPTKDGRFCSFCEKEVIDFRSLNTDELIAWFGKNDRKICGHFDHDQLDAIKKDKIAARGWAFNSKIILASCLALFAGTKVYSSTLLKSGHIIYEEKDRLSKKLLIIEQRKDTLMITGKVKDSVDQKDIPGVRVLLKGTTQHTFTDQYGKFKLPILLKDEKQVVLIFSYPGYLTKEIIVPSEKTEELMVGLVINENQLMGAVVITGTKPTFWGRIVRFIKRPFRSH